MKETKLGTKQKFTTYILSPVLIPESRLNSEYRDDSNSEAIESG